MRDHRLAVAAATLLALAGCGGPADATGASRPVVTGAVVSATAAGFHAAAYVRVDQPGGDDQLVAISTAAAERVTLMGPGVAMSASAAASGFPVELPAGAQVIYSPGGDHIMLEAVRDDLVAGEQVDLRLTFERAADIVVSADVVAPADLLDRAPTAGT